MLAVTESAGARLAEKLDEKSASTDAVMRFVRRPRGWKLLLDRPSSGDVVFAHKGRTVLVLDAQAAQALVDRTLDAERSDTGSRLCLR